MHYILPSRRKYGRLKVLRPAGSNWQGKATWLCQCECGNQLVADAYQVRVGRTTSCGCAQQAAACKAKTTHGQSKTPTYKSWSSMRARCENPKSVQWKHYGGRGIRVCRRWKKFENFLADMGPRPGKRHCIDRIDPDGGYSPANCRWNLKGRGTQRPRRRSCEKDAGCGTASRRSSSLGGCRGRMLASPGTPSSSSPRPFLGATSCPGMSAPRRATLEQRSGGITHEHSHSRIIT